MQEGCKLNKHSAAVVLCAVVLGIGLYGCGEEGTSSVTGSTPTPTQTAIPGGFTGNFTGSAALDAGRTATVALSVQNDTTATGRLTISGGTTADTVVPLSGFADLIGGSFSLSGGSETVSGTLPGPSGTGFLSVQVGANTTPFHGTINRAQ